MVSVLEMVDFLRRATWLRHGGPAANPCRDYERAAAWIPESRDSMADVPVASRVSWSSLVVRWVLLGPWVRHWVPRGHSGWRAMRTWSGVGGVERCPGGIATRPAPPMAAMSRPRGCAAGGPTGSRWSSGTGPARPCGGWPPASAGSRPSPSCRIPMSSCTKSS